MKLLQNWEQTLQYVNRLGLAHRTMPIGWRQQVLMDNVKAIEHIANTPYPFKVKYFRHADCFMVNNMTVKASHR